MEKFWLGTVWLYQSGGGRRIAAIACARILHGLRLLSAYSAGIKEEREHTAFARVHLVLGSIPTLVILIWLDIFWQEDYSQVISHIAFHEAILVGISLAW